MTVNPINIPQVIEYLNHTFSDVLEEAKHIVDTDTLRQHQEDFCYVVNEIETGPLYSAPNSITKAKDIIRTIEEYT